MGMRPTPMVERFHELTPLIGGKPRVRSLCTGKRDRHITQVRCLDGRVIHST